MVKQNQMITEMRTYFAGSKTLVAGTLDVKTPLQEVLSVEIQQNVASPLTEIFGWEATGGTVTLTSDNGASTAVLHVIIKGV